MRGTFYIGGGGMDGATLIRFYCEMYHKLIGVYMVYCAGYSKCMNACSQLFSVVHSLFSIESST